MALQMPLSLTKKFSRYLLLSYLQSAVLDCHLKFIFLSHSKSIIVCKCIYNCHRRTDCVKQSYLYYTYDTFRITSKTWVKIETKIYIDTVVRVNINN